VHPVSVCSNVGCALFGDGRSVELSDALTLHSGNCGDCLPVGLHGGPISLLVDNPILNSPFEEPKRHWTYKEGQPVLWTAQACRVLPEAAHAGWADCLFEEEFVPLDTVNGIRDKVLAAEKAIRRDQWHHSATARHWTRAERERRFSSADEQQRH